MTKEEAKYFYPILQAFAEGKVVDFMVQNIMINNINNYGNQKD